MTSKQDIIFYRLVDLRVSVLNEGVSQVKHVLELNSKNSKIARTRLEIKRIWSIDT